MGLTVQCFLFLQLFIIDILPSTASLDDAFHYYEDGTCLLNNFTLESTFQRPGECSRFFLQSVNITESSKELFDELGDGLETFGVFKSVVESIYVPQNLISFTVTGTVGCTTQTIVDENSTYKLEEITLNNLPLLPVNIDKLVALKDFTCKNIHGGSVHLIKFANMFQLDKVIILDTAGVTVSNSLELPSLRMLTIRNSQITLLNESTCSFPSLATLYLENNNLEEIPQNFSTFHNVTHFTIKGNKLRHISLNTFASMNHLEHLDLTGNQISATATSTTLHLPYLKTLLLAGNKLTTLDVTLWNLPALEYLLLDDNKLQQVPSLPKLITTNLQSLLMRDNPWDCKWLSRTIGQIAGMQIFASRNGSCFAFGRVKSGDEQTVWRKDYEQ